MLPRGTERTAAAAPFPRRPGRAEEGSDPGRGRPSQTALLYRHFLRRFFDNELFVPGTEPSSALATVGIALGTPGLLVAFYAAPLAGGIDLRPLLMGFALVSGLLTALAAVLQWEALFPDLTDAAVLLALPVPPRRIFAAKIAALGTLLAGLQLAINMFSATLIPLLDAPQNGGFSALLALDAHQVSAVAATGAAAFFAVLALQALLVCTLGYGGYRAVGQRLQLAAVVVVLAALLFSPHLFTAQAMRETAWTWSRRLWLWAAALALAALALYALGFRRFLRGLAGASAARRRRRALRWRDWGSVRACAVGRFILLTLARSRRHRLIVATWVALGAAVLLEAGLELAANIRHATSDDIFRTGLMIPLVLSLFTLAGLRFCFTVPSDLGANWIFRLAHGAAPRDLLGGARRVLALYLAVLLAPAALLTARLQGWRTAGAHLAFVALAGVALAQALTQRFDKVPFTCSYHPGRANLKLRWPAYWIVFTVYAYTFAAWEERLLRHPAGFAAALAGGGALCLLLEWERQRWLAGGVRCRFDDPPESLQRLFGE